LNIFVLFFVCTDTNIYRNTHYCNVHYDKKIQLFRRKGFSIEGYRYPF